VLAGAHHCLILWEDRMRGSSADAPSSKDVGTVHRLYIDGLRRSIATQSILFRNEDVNRRRGPHLYFPTILPPTKIFFLGRRNIVNFPEYTKPAVWGAIAGAVAMVIVGFSSLGWTTAGTAQRLAKQSADEAVVAALVPVCVAKAKLDSVELARFEAEPSSYTRGQMVTAAGWANFGGETTPDYALARACSEKLEAMKAN
jgi:hypothetical protein